MSIIRYVCNYKTGHTKYRFFLLIRFFFVFFIKIIIVRLFHSFTWIRFRVPSVRARRGAPTSRTSHHAKNSCSIIPELLDDISWLCPSYVVDFFDVFMVYFKFFPWCDSCTLKLAIRVMYRCNLLKVKKIINKFIYGYIFFLILIGELQLKQN